MDPHIEWTATTTTTTLEYAITSADPIPVEYSRTNKHLAPSRATVVIVDGTVTRVDIYGGLLLKDNTVSDKAVHTRTYRDGDTKNWGVWHPGVPGWIRNLAARAARSTDPSWQRPDRDEIDR